MREKVVATIFIVILVISISNLNACEPINIFSVRYVGPLIEHVKNDGKVIGQDGAYSVSLKKGNLWLFGDTFFGTFNSDRSFKYKGTVHNNAFYTDDVKASDGITGIEYKKDSDGFATYLLNNAEAENPKKIKLWPGHGIQTGKGIYLFYSLVEIFGEGSFDFRHVGQGIAFGKTPLGHFQRLKYRGNFSFWNKDEPRFGVSVYTDTDGWVYIYGRDESAPYGFKVAKVRKDQIANPNAYLYFSKKGKWISKMDQAIILFESGPAEASVSYNQFVGKYLLLYSRFFEKDVVVRLADNPWGPWSNTISIYKCKPKKKDGFCYAAKEHPQYSEKEGGIIYFTVVDSSCMFCSLPDIYEVVFE